MSSPRRRIIRPSTQDPSLRERLIQRAEQRLIQERAALARWQKRLRRAFTTVERLRKVIDRLERGKRTLEGKG